MQTSYSPTMTIGRLLNPLHHARIVSEGVSRRTLIMEVPTLPVAPSTAYVAMMNEQDTASGWKLFASDGDLLDRQDAIE